MRRASHYGSPGVLFIPRDVVQPGSIPRSDRVGRFTNRPYTSCRPDVGRFTNRPYTSCRPDVGRFKSLHSCHCSFGCAYLNK